MLHLSWDASFSSTCWVASFFPELANWFTVLSSFRLLPQTRCVPQRLAGSFRQAINNSSHRQPHMRLSWTWVTVCVREARYQRRVFEERLLASGRCDPAVRFIHNRMYERRLVESLRRTTVTWRRKETVNSLTY